MSCVLLPHAILYRENAFSVMMDALGLTFGVLAFFLSIVVHELRRLSNNRLMQVTGNQRVRRYSLTPLGERVLATRRREWEAFSYGFNRVLEAADDVDRITNHVLGDACTPGNPKECTFTTVRPVVDHCMNGDLDDLLS